MKKFNWKEALNFIRGIIRPYLAFIFPTAVVIIGAVVVFTLLPIAVKYIDKDISLLIIGVILTIVTAIVTASTMVMAFYFAERATKPKAEK